MSTYSSLTNVTVWDWQWHFARSKPRRWLTRVPNLENIYMIQHLLLKKSIKPQPLYQLFKHWKRTMQNVIFHTVTFYLYAFLSFQSAYDKIRSETDHENLGDIIPFQKCFLLSTVLCLFLKKVESWGYCLSSIKIGSYYNYFSMHTQKMGELDKVLLLEILHSLSGGCDE